MFEFIIGQADVINETIKVSENKNWAEFGLAGLVIAALFGVIFYILSEHKSERKEWRTESKDMGEKTVSAITALTKAVNERKIS